jgi:hypothetical protein
MTGCGARQEMGDRSRAVVQTQMIGLKFLFSWGFYPSELCDPVLQQPPGL